MLQNMYFSNTCCSFELYIHQRILKKHVIDQEAKLSSKMFSTIRTQKDKIIIYNIRMIINDHIAIICEGSRDPESWSNATENLALHHRNKLLFRY